MALFGKKKTEDQVQKNETGSAETISMPLSNDVNSLGVIIGSHMTEKATMANANGVYTFKIAHTANKINVKKAVESLYKVKVAKVAVINIPAKRRRMGRQMGWKAGYRKAIITLKEGHSIQSN